MKGIREAALNREEPEHEVRRKSFDLDRDEVGYFDPEYGYGTPYHRQDSLFEGNKKKAATSASTQLRVSLTIDIALLGNLVDEDSPDYDLNAASDKATAMAKEALVALAGKDFASRYASEIAVEESWDEFEVITTLTPLT